jgi:hypothetical protein
MKGEMRKLRQIATQTSHIRKERKQINELLQRKEEDCLPAAAR